MQAPLDASALNAAHKNKIVSAADAVQLIHDGDTVATGGFVGIGFAESIAVALAQAVWHFTLIRTRTREGCFKAFRINHWLGATVCAGIAGSYMVRAVLTN